MLKLITALMNKENKEVIFQHFAISALQIAKENHKSVPLLGQRGWRLWMCLSPEDKYAIICP